MNESRYSKYRGPDRETLDSLALYIFLKTDCKERNVIGTYNGWILDSGKRISDPVECAEMLDYIRMLLKTNRSDLGDALLKDGLVNQKEINDAIERSTDINNDADCVKAW